MELGARLDRSALRIGYYKIVLSYHRGEAGRI